MIKLKRILTNVHAILNVENVLDLPSDSFYNHNSPFVHNNLIVHNKDITKKKPTNAKDQHNSRPRLREKHTTPNHSRRAARSTSPLRTPTRKPTPQVVTVDLNRNNHDFSRVPVGARLFRFRTVWKGAHETIIKKGLGWTWKKCPPPRKRLKQKVSRALDHIMKELQQKRVIEKAKLLKWQSRLFTVPKKDTDKERLILDLSILNSFINRPSFKMLTLREVKLLLPQGYWTTSIDFRDGYWHVPISPGKRPYLGFSYRGQD